VSLSLAVLGLTAIAQTAVFVASGSIALLADLIHNFGDALTAIPLGIARMGKTKIAASGLVREQLAKFGIDLDDLGDRADVEARVNEVLDS